MLEAGLLVKCKEVLFDISDLAAHQLIFDGQQLIIQAADQGGGMCFTAGHVSKVHVHIHDELDDERAEKGDRTQTATPPTPKKNAYAHVGVGVGTGFQTADSYFLSPALRFLGL